jgi:GT2 family glycosyltransferase
MRSHPEAGMAGPAILDEHGTTNFAGGLLTARQVLLGAAGLSPWERQRTTIAENSPAFRTTWLSGALLLARTEAANRLGGFDPRFFLYFEETDLCKRMADAGYELWAVGEAVATHVGGVSVAKTGETATHSGCIARHYYESRFYYMVKHHGWAAAALAEGGELGFKAGRDVLDVVFRRGKGIRELRSRLRGPLFRMPPVTR